MAGAATDGLTIVLTSVPAATPPDATIYVAGSFNKWQTDDAAYRLTASGGGQYSITLPASVRGPVEFKFTLGSWDSAELDANGVEIQNRKFAVPASGPATYSDTVQNWHLPARTIAELQQELEKILATTHTPGLSVAIVRREGPEWIAGLGKADVASDRPATADTLFRIGSVSKAFAALAILKLENEGRLSLRDSVRHLAPDVWFENRWEDTDPVRVVDLLEHTTGWDDMHLREYAKDAPNMSLADALAYYHHSRISRWPPGTRMAYCNSGPAVAAYIVEKITGQRFEDYVTQNFLEPIGMKTATYFQAGAAQMATLYRDDGRSPFPYWNILFRPAGSINASANDMAAYLAFYLNRGTVGGTLVLPAASAERMEVPTRNWAAQAGLKYGYGLYNYTTLDQGRVFHGHDGGVTGGLTKMAYLPDEGVGYAYSINAGNGDAFARINKALRAYVTRGLAKPKLPAAGPLPDMTPSYAGWYEPDSSRNETFRFLERLGGLMKLRIEGGTLIASPAAAFLGQEARFTPVRGSTWRTEPEAVATAALVSPPDGQRYVVIGMQTLKRIPAWLAFVEIGLTAWFVLAAAMTLLYAPFWMLASVRKTWRRPHELWIRLWPLVAVLCIVAGVVIFQLASEDLIDRLGRITAWSAGLFLATVVFALASVASVIALWSARRSPVRRFVYGYCAATTAALLIAVSYFAYWGIIGIRTWA